MIFDSFIIWLKWSNWKELTKNYQKCTYLFIGYHFIVIFCWLLPLFLLQKFACNINLKFFSNFRFWRLALHICSLIWTRPTASTFSIYRRLSVSTGWSNLPIDSSRNHFRRFRRRNSWRFPSNKWNDFWRRTFQSTSQKSTSSIWFWPGKQKDKKSE